MKNKLEEFITKDVSKSSDVTIQIEDKGTNTNPFDITTQKEEKPVEGKTYSDVAVQMMKNPNEYFVTNPTTSLFEVN